METIFGFMVVMAVAGFFYFVIGDSLGKGVGVIAVVVCIAAIFAGIAFSESKDTIEDKATGFVSEVTGIDKIVDGISLKGLGK